MAIFKKSSEVEKAEVTLATLLKQRERLAEQETKQRTALDAAILARRRALRDETASDSKAIVAAQNADASLNSIRDALDDLSTDIDAAQAAVVAARDRAGRVAEAASREIDLAAARGAAGELIARLDEFAESFERLSNVPSDCAGLANFARRASAELKVTSTIAVSEIKAYIDAVTAGRTAIRAYAAPPPPPPPRPAPLPTMSVFAIENLKWKDAEGKTQTMPKYLTGEVPIALAQLAIAKNLADEPTSNRAAKLREAFGDGWHPVDAAVCFDLDAGGEPPVKRLGKGSRYHGPDNIGPLEMPTFVTKPAATVTGTISARRFDDKRGSK